MLSCPPFISTEQHGIHEALSFPLHQILASVQLVNVGSTQIHKQAYVFLPRMVLSRSGSSFISVRTSFRLHNNRICLYIGKGNKQTDDKETDAYQGVFRSFVLHPVHLLIGRDNARSNQILFVRFHITDTGIYKCQPVSGHGIQLHIDRKVFKGFLITRFRFVISLVAV